VFIVLSYEPSSPRDSNQLKEHAIRMTTHPNDRFWTTVNLESNMNKIRNGAFFAIAATACTLLVPEGAGRLDPGGQVSA
jgi:hypothetical protein